MAAFKSTLFSSFHAQHPRGLQTVPRSVLHLLVAQGASPKNSSDSRRHCLPDVIIFRTGQDPALIGEMAVQTKVEMKKAGAITVASGTDDVLRSEIEGPRENENMRRYVEEPVVRFSELLRIMRVGRSKAYLLMNPSSPQFDANFPKGFALFDSTNSPKGYWRHEAMAWLERRSKKFRNQDKENNQ